MDIKKLEEVIRKLKDIDNQFYKMEIFDYKTPDEPGYMSCSRPGLFIEIGGLSAHIRIHIENREEADLTKTIIVGMLSKRKDKYTQQLNQICKERTVDMGYHLEDVKSYQSKMDHSNITDLQKNRRVGKKAKRNNKTTL